MTRTRLLVGSLVVWALTTIWVVTGDPTPLSKAILWLMLSTIALATPLHGLVRALRGRKAIELESSPEWILASSYVDREGLRFVGGLIVMVIGFAAVLNWSEVIVPAFYAMLIVIINGSLLDRVRAEEAREGLKKQTAFIKGVIAAEPNRVMQDREEKMEAREVRMGEREMEIEEREEED